MKGTEWRRASVLVAVIGALHVAGLAAVLAGAAGAGIALTAYTLGLRHAFDADHIAAIDGTTRRLSGEGRRAPLSVGFFFALGHSTVVFLVAALVVLGLGAVADDATLHTVTGVIGPGVSGTFLLVVAAMNVAMLRSGGSGGVLTRIYGRATRAVRRPWQMYPLGFLFGLGFDTATEIALLVLAAGAGSSGLWLPLAFAAGMTLLDTADGALMGRAYGWALTRPARRRYVNVVLTTLSAGVALLVGSVELAGLVWPPAAGVDLNAIGLAVVALFALTFALAAALWRFGRLEERWS
jgi:high-affinity nickel-transport protein